MGNGNPLQYYCLKNSIYRGAWWAAVHGVAKSWIWLSTCTGEGNGTPLQYCCPENPKDGGAWWAAVHGVAKSRTGLSDFTFTFHFHALEKEMATHSSILVWRIPWMEKPGGLQSMGSHRVRHDWSDLVVVYICIVYAQIFLKNIIEFEYHFQLAVLTHICCGQS